MDIIKQQVPSNILKIDKLPNFQIQVAIGQLEKPIATNALKFDNADHIFAEHFVVMKNITGPVIDCNSGDITVWSSTLHMASSIPHT